MTEPISGIEKYHVWLGTLEPRISEILVALDDEYCSGRIGSRQRFVGDLEFRLLAVAKDGTDFIEIMKIVQPDRDAFEAEEHARVIWNVAINYSNLKNRELLTMITTRSK